MTDAQIVQALANIASKGKYEVTPEGANIMNSVFVKVADLINRLEAAEDANTCEALGAEENASE